MVAGADSVYGIVADPCDCMNYYQCEFNATLGEFIAYQRTCNPCEIWDQDVLTCVWDPAKPDCRFFPSTEGIGKINFRFVEYMPWHIHIDYHYVQQIVADQQYTCIGLILPSTPID